jgi:hypothetical protein
MAQSLMDAHVSSIGGSGLVGEVVGDGAWRHPTAADVAVCNPARSTVMQGNARLRELRWGTETGAGCSDGGGEARRRELGIGGSNGGAAGSSRARGEAATPFYRR